MEFDQILPIIPSSSPESEMGDENDESEWANFRHCSDLGKMGGKVVTFVPNFFADCERLGNPSQHSYNNPV